MIRLTAQLSDPAAGVQRQLADAQDANRKLRAELQTARAAAAAGGPASRPKTAAVPRPRQPGGDVQQSGLPAPGAIQQKAALDGRYAGLFKALNLSPEQLDNSRTCWSKAAGAAGRAAGRPRPGARFGPAGRPGSDRRGAGDADKQIQGALGEGLCAVPAIRPDRAGTHHGQPGAAGPELQPTPLTDEQWQPTAPDVVQNQDAPASAAAPARRKPGRRAGGRRRGGRAGPDPGPKLLRSPPGRQPGGHFLAPDQIQALQQVQAQQQAPSRCSSFSARAGPGQRSGRRRPARWRPPAEQTRGRPGKARRLRLSPRVPVTTLAHQAYLTHSP